MSKLSIVLTLLVVFVVVQILLWIKSHRDQPLVLLKGIQGRTKVEQIVSNINQTSNIIQNTHPNASITSGTRLIPTAKAYESSQNVNTSRTSTTAPGANNNNNMKKNSSNAGYSEGNVRNRIKNVAISKPMSWLEFTSLSNDNYVSAADEKIEPIKNKYAPILCSTNITIMLNEKTVSMEDIRWCRWAISSTGGKVVVGRSWGSLTNSPDRIKFDSLNCNAVSKNMNPSCNDKWGDKLLNFWRNNKISKKCKGKSKIHCYESVNNDRFCVVEDVQINFKLMRNDTKPGISSFSRLFDKGFISTDCGDTGMLPLYEQLNQLHSSQLVSSQCDYTLMGNTIIFSHERANNVGHFMQDIMNVWVLLWVTKLARYSIYTSFLNIDAILDGYFSFNDEPNQFFNLYYHNFLNVIRGSSYGNKTLCIKRVIFQPLQPVLFVRDGWDADQKCSFIGPSSLYQRYNIHMRNSYNLLHVNSNKFKIMFIIRKETEDTWGSERTSRILLNELKLIETLKKELDGREFTVTVEFRAVDLSSLSVNEQIVLFHSSNIIIGMHGAGIVFSSMHLPIGVKNCCGVLEIYPNGEFTPIRGHGNMIREMGIHYSRLDLTSDESSSDGVTINSGPLLSMLQQLIYTTIERPTCILPEVYYNPYFE